MGCPTTVYIGENLTFSICTHDPDTGVLTDADAPPLYRVYEDETPGAILNGTMAILDNINTTGFYTEEIACTAGNGFEDGRSYTIYIEATVDGDTGGISYGFKARTDPLAVVLPEITGAADIPAIATIPQVLTLIYMWLRNATEATANERRVFNDAGVEVLDAPMSDDTVTFNQGQLGAP